MKKGKSAVQVMVTKDEAKFNPILFGGDQLTAARARSAMKVRVNSNTSAKKFSSIIPVVEDWHMKTNFLGGGSMSMYFT